MDANIAKKHLDFGLALHLLKNKKKIRREGWNNSDAFLELQVPDANSKMTLPYIYMEYPVGSKPYPQGCKVPWLASQTDMLANDWEVVE